MDGQTIALILSAVMQIVQRHYEKTGTILTTEEVKARLTAEIAAGQSEIAAWFAAKGLPAPQ